MAKEGKGRRESILDEATRLFAERGYEGASMADLAERVGLRKASLFHHFASKEELRTAVLERLVREVTSALAIAVAAEGSFEERADTLSAGITDILGEQPYAARLLMREAMEWGPDATNPTALAIATVLEASVQFIRAGQQAGVFKEVDAAQVMITLAGMHMMPFAIAGVAERLTKLRPFEPEFAAARRAAVKAHVRSLLIKGA
jgi:AcrR family transcriptional regulator